MAQPLARLAETMLTPLTTHLSEPAKRVNFVADELGAELPLRPDAAIRLRMELAH